MTNPGPIDYVGEKKPKAPKKPSRFAWLGGLGMLVGLFAAFIGYALLGGVVRPMILAYACDATACATEGMVIAGWLVVALPAVLIGTTVAVSKLVGQTTRRILFTLCAVTTLVALMFIPGRRKSLSDILEGPGADQFGDGLLWAAGAVGAALAVVFLLVLVGRKAPAVERHFTVIAGVLAAALLIAAVPVAISKTYPSSVKAEEIFPAVLEMNDDVLTRTAAGDQRGCDGVLAEDSPLNREHCILTVHAAYRTDDSDAVASLWAVLYADDETADIVRDTLAKPTSETAITVLSTSHSWVLVGISAHADGATIASADRPWVMWPLRQVAYRFIGYQAGLLIDPDPGDEIHPRTT
ncbi:hypothetical protein AB0H43_28430 [Hamadaea sp. NPDC050747]|uniref:hypothetical protein n=1 Tax=Hamadaea sp. NPDC050747 TaxID=3155789 RepID=UPI0033F7DB49